jgi:hypothetical protein
MTKADRVHSTPRRTAPKIQKVKRTAQGAGAKLTSAAAEIAALDEALEALYKKYGEDRESRDDFLNMEARRFELLELLGSTPSTSRAGIEAKATALLMKEATFDDHRFGNIAESLAQDILHLGAMATSRRWPVLDPIWAVIKQHRSARAAYSEAVSVEFAAEGKIPEREFRALQSKTCKATKELMAAGRSILTTRPTTLFGIIAVLRYLESQFGNFDGTSCIYLPEEIDRRSLMQVFADTLAGALISM